MKAIIGLTLKEAKEVAKQELGVKRMGDARFQMILDEGVRKGELAIVGDMIQEPCLEDPFDLLEQAIDETPPPSIATKVIHPEEAHLDPKLSSSDLPRAGDLYHYRNYHGDVVQGEVKSMICFAECQNPDGTWQTVAFQDLYLKKKGVPKETLLNSLKAYYQTNDYLHAEHKRLLKEINQLKDDLNDLKKVTP
jgi:hypothetical protein